MEPNKVNPLLNDVREAADEDLRALMHLNRTVRTARRGGVSWADIGKALGVTKQAAQQRFGRTVGEDPTTIEFKEPEL